MEQTTVLELGQRAKAVANVLAAASPKAKNDALTAIADALIARTDEIIAANKVDLDNAVKNNMSKAMQDRLLLDPKLPLLRCVSLLPRWTLLLPLLRCISLLPPRWKFPLLRCISLLPRCMSPLPKRPLPVLRLLSRPMLRLPDPNERLSF